MCLYDKNIKYIIIIIEIFIFLIITYYNYLILINRFKFKQNYKLFIWTKNNDFSYFIVPNLKMLFEDIWNL